MNQSETDLGIVNESQLLRFGIRMRRLAVNFRADSHSASRLTASIVGERVQMPTRWSKLKGICDPASRKPAPNLIGRDRS